MRALIVALFVVLAFTGCEKTAQELASERATAIAAIEAREERLAREHAAKLAAEREQAVRDAEASKRRYAFFGAVFTIAGFVAAAIGVGKLVLRFASQQLDLKRRKALYEKAVDGLVKVAHSLPAAERNALLARMVRGAARPEAVDDRFLQLEPPAFPRGVRP